MNTAEELDISYRGLNDEQFYAEIAKYPNLVKLSCKNNKITNLDYLPVSLQELHCSDNQITSLDHLPASLQILYCGGNQITSLDHLPFRLEELDCCYNQISSLDHLPSTLRILGCNNNLITSLDYLPTSLQKLYITTSPLIIILYPSLRYIKRSKYLRFLRNSQNTRKTITWMCLVALRKQSYLLAECLPDEIIRKIIGFL